MDFKQLRNPVWERSDNLRDPSIYKTEEGYHLFYSRYSNKDWSRPENWAIGYTFTKDFVHYEKDRDISAKGFASPGDLILWNGKYILPYQSYPETPTMLCYSVSEDLKYWSEPVFFLEEARNLPWNQAERVIDPTFVVDGDRLHCFFVGTDRMHYERATNLVGHAYTDDPELKKWVITTAESPLIGASKAAPDGAENVTVYRKQDEWVMIYSEGLFEQHLAYAVSPDLIQWEFKGKIDIEAQNWITVRYGAPYVWKEEECFMMILMGEDKNNHTTFGLLSSQDGIHWKMLKENKSH
ncbi:hypothetical protein Ana3638_01990 [Anaerocolumna sedimenticola]|uniref:Glycosyl hydrolase family 32 N-terminal domain-containing protein n=1 Tax=Anaerocolumna sedimenticola TaxID=2696063 RepID=A0A6P1THE1_9FIRM|nr:hypothetical protein [Anaerocolumna sedimenticola]QHQ59717.1 hypothetical protein Ana3638_01990 [Anaerocolumna sedimenticola]